MTHQSEISVGPSRPGFMAGLLAASMHLGYLPVGAAVIGAVIFPSNADVALVFCVVWTLLALVAFRWRPESSFLRQHLQQARHYHRFGMMALVSAVVGTIYVSIFTWGLGAILALGIAPPLLLAWMLPTWSAARDAIQGREHHYSRWAVPLSAEKGRTH